MNLNEEYLSNIFVVPEMKSEEDPTPMLHIINNNDFLLCIDSAYAFTEYQSLNEDFLANLSGMIIAPHSSYRFVFVGDDMQNPPAESFKFVLHVFKSYTLTYDINFKFRNMFIKYCDSECINVREPQLPSGIRNTFNEVIRAIKNIRKREE